MAALEHIRLQWHLNSFLCNCSVFKKNLPKQKILLSSNLFAASTLNIFSQQSLKVQNAYFFSYLARLETEKWSDFRKATGRSCVSAGMISVKDTYPSFSLSLAIFIIIAYAVNLITVDTSVLSLRWHQEIELASFTYSIDSWNSLSLKQSGIAS